MRSAQEERGGFVDGRGAGLGCVAGRDAAADAGWWVGGFSGSVAEDG